MTTFVLIHGAYQGGWIWQPVSDRLRAQGHQVYCPTLDGCAERSGSLRRGITTETHGAEIAALLYYEDLDNVALVGTSSGGMVVCRAAELARDRVAKVVFADALALDDGERISDFVSRPTAVDTELATGPSSKDASERLFGDLMPDLRRWAVERITLHPIAAMTEPVQLDSFWDQYWTAQVIYCARSTNPPEAHQRRTADRLGAIWSELDTGHYPMLSMPEEFTSLLVADPG